MFELSHLLLILLLFSGLATAIGYAAEKHRLPKKLLHHPGVYTLSLGGYAGIWAVFGTISLAGDQGYLFLAFYIGTSAIFLFSPLILQPLLNLSRTYQLSSLADLFSFRYCSQWAGSLVAIGTLISVLPLMTMQISILAESVTFLTPIFSQAENRFAQDTLAGTFALTVIFTALIFGTADIHTHGRHQGLVINVAFQSFIKLALFLVLGGIALFAVFGSPTGLEQWLQEQPDKLAMLSHSLTSNNHRSLVLIFAAAALAFPHMYHLALTETPNPRALSHASWAYPLYLLLLSLPVLPILWAGEASNLHTPTQFFAYALSKITGVPALSLLAFICAIAAASASMVVIAISTASMCLNHLILPYYPAKTRLSVYHGLIPLKRALVITIVGLAYVSYLTVNELPVLTGFSLASYTAAFQFLPGILAALYWPKGNRTGLISGLTVGFLGWGVSILLPLVSHDALGMMPVLQKLFNLSEDSYWSIAAAACLGLNMVTFGFVSITSKTDEEQQYAAKICSQDDLSRPMRQRLALNSVEEIHARLSEAIGPKTATDEINSALHKLNMQMDETRPYALRLLRRQLESNLSGLYGPTVSRQIVAQYLPYEQSEPGKTSEDIQLIEERLEDTQNHLTGLAAELNKLRRYHRNTIENLPIGVCALGQDGEISLWNTSMEILTGISTENAIGSELQALPAPWNRVLIDFLHGQEEDQYKTQVDHNGDQRWFTLHKTHPHDNNQTENQTLLLEEVTAVVQLEKELLHNERLASIGRLAAGVAHEIGNPITGIACLAQNLKYDSDHPAVTDAAKDILTQTQRVTRIVQSLVNFSHAGAHGSQLVFTPVNLFLCADDAIHLLSLSQRTATDIISNKIIPGHHALGDTQALLQVFLNLLKNALDACDESCQVILQSFDRPPFIELHITDNGPGIHPDIQEQIFEPFFTTKEPGEGTGLGLAMVYNIIEEHHGQIQLHSPVSENPPRGTRFIIRLPKALPDEME